MSTTGWHSNRIKKLVGPLELLVTTGQDFVTREPAYFWTVSKGMAVLALGHCSSLGAAKATATRHAHTLVCSDREAGDAR